MSQELHAIDKPTGIYDVKELDEFMVFCIIDTAVHYEMVCKTFDALRKSKMTKRRDIMKWREDMIEYTLKKSGYRFPKQHAGRIKAFGYSGIDLRTATREELVRDIKGVGMKLASMFLRNTRGHKYAVIDVHTDRWLEKELKAYDQWKPKMSYEEKEKAFINFAKILDKTPMELDLEIWQKNRIGNRRKKK
jgi:thermostable 8-oxoguanine DNA glycosylase